MILRQRQPRVECRAFLAFVRRRPCCACGAPAPSQAAHVRRGCEERGKRATGAGEKPDDRWAAPLCRECHLDAPDSQHRVGESAFWARVGVDPFAIAADLYGQFCAVAKVRFRKVIAASVKKLAQPVKRRVAFLGKNKASRPIPRRANPWPSGRKLRSRQWSTRP